MSTTSAATAPRGEHVVDLHNPALAAFLAWLLPGAGHLYQGRTGKGILYLVCILGTFLYGLYLGDGKVVYFVWRPNDTRWAYFCQVGVGLAALPALIQAERIGSGRGPLLNLEFMAPPEAGEAWQARGKIASRRAQEQGGAAPDLEKFQSPDELAWWNKYLNRYFELGTVYTMIAGLLNVLAIYDAYAGPVPVETSEEDEKSDE